MNNISIGQKIRQARLAKSQTLSSLSEKVGIDIGTLSRIENGILGKTRENIDKLYEHFGLEKELDTEASILVRVGYPAILWSGPLISLALSDEKPRHLQMTCLFKNNNPENPDFDKKFNSLKLRDKGSDYQTKIYTAKELIAGLDNDAFDLIFLPSGTSDGYLGFSKVGFITNTTKNGVLVLAIFKKTKKEDPFDNEDLNEVITTCANNNEIAILLPEKTIAEKIHEKYFDISTGIETEFVNVNDIDILTNEVKEKTELFFASGKKIVLFLGWDYNVFNLKRLLLNELYITRVIDSWEFAKKNDPFFNVTLDIVVKKDTLKSKRFLKELNDFLEIVNSHIAYLKKKSSTKGINPSLKKIINFLDLESLNLDNEGLTAIRKTNYSLMYYPEFVQELVNNIENNHLK